jgi:hypothetical protein
VVGYKGEVDATDKAADIYYHGKEQGDMDAK